jgi:hypothetical protein
LRELVGKFAFIAFTFLFSALAHSQQVDVTVGAGIMESPTPNLTSLSFQQPAEKGGIYPVVGADFVGTFRNHHRVGLSAETSWRNGKANYPFTGETYRPFLTDVNALYQPRLTKKIGLDLSAGIGFASTQFFLPPASVCTAPGGGCTNYTSSTHFLEDIGGGLRYYVWHRIPHVFVRPEIRYYHIQSNYQFHSDNVARLGASIGYTFGSK